MNAPLPLVDASKRLRKRPGRPRKAAGLDIQTTGAVAGQASAPPATPLDMRPPEATVAEVGPNGQRKPSAGGDDKFKRLTAFQRRHDFLPRLLDLEGAARYLCLSEWTIRAWIADGSLGKVQLPAPKRNEGDRRRILLDRLDLDRLIERSKDGDGVGA